MNKENENNNEVNTQYKSLWETSTDTNIEVTPEQTAEVVVPIVEEVIPEQTIEPVVPVVEEKTEEVIEKNTSKSSAKNSIFVFLLFTMILVFIWFLPDIDEYIKTKMNASKEAEYLEELQEEEDSKKTEEVVEPTPSEVVENTCNLTSTSSDGIQLDTSIILYSQDGKINKVEKTVTETFVSQSDLFTTTLNECNLEKTAFTEVEGYIQTCTNNELIIVKSQTFDLTSFESVTKQVNGVDKTLIIDISNDANLEEEQEKLTFQGYTCD